MRLLRVVNLTLFEIKPRSSRGEARSGVIDPIATLMGLLLAVHIMVHEHSKPAEYFGKMLHRRWGIYKPITLDRSFYPVSI